MASGVISHGVESSVLGCAAYLIQDVDGSVRLISGGNVSVTSKPANSFTSKEQVSNPLTGRENALEQERMGAKIHPFSGHRPQLYECLHSASLIWIDLKNRRSKLTSVDGDAKGAVVVARIGARNEVENVHLSSRQHFKQQLYHSSITCRIHNNDASSLCF